MKKDIYKRIHFAVPQKPTQWKATQSAHQHTVQTNCISIFKKQHPVTWTAQHKRRQAISSEPQTRPGAPHPPSRLHSPAGRRALPPVPEHSLRPRPPRPPRRHTSCLAQHHSPESRPTPSFSSRRQCIFLLKLHRLYSSCNHSVENEDAEVQRMDSESLDLASKPPLLPPSTPPCEQPTPALAQAQPLQPSALWAQTKIPPAP